MLSGNFTTQRLKFDQEHRKANPLEGSISSNNQSEEVIFIELRFRLER